MKLFLTIINYIFRAFLAYTFIPHGWEKLTQKINPKEYINFGLGGDFLDFYLILERTNFIWVIGIAQLLGGILLIYKPTHLFASILLLPISVGMVCCHLFISKSQNFLIFDVVILILNLFLIFQHYSKIKHLFTFNTY